MPRPSALIPKPDASLFDAETQGWPDRDWYGFWREVQARLPISGTATFAGGTTTVDVSLAKSELSDEYNVFIEAPEDRRVWITGKLVSGFTINVSANSSATYFWSIVRR